MSAEIVNEHGYLAEIGEDPESDVPGHREIVADRPMVTRTEFAAWLARHDIDIRRVKQVAFVLEHGRRADTSVYLRVDRYVENAQGGLFAIRDEKADGSVEYVAASESLLFPVIDLPATE